jgi:hypothetical protein
VVSWYGATKFPFTQVGEGSGGQTKHGRQAYEGVCETLFYLWNDFEFDVLFAVPKGDTDIILVYNGTLSGLNAHLSAPWFALPTVFALMRALELDTFMADSDFGVMFLNLVLEERCARLAGVYLTHDVEMGEGALEGKRHMVRWGRCLMGGAFSPYQTGQGMRHARSWEILMMSRMFFTGGKFG